MAKRVDYQEDVNSYPDPHPIQEPDISPEKPDPSWSRGYSRYFRKMDNVVVMAMSGMKITAEGVSFGVPTMFGTFEKIVMSIFGDTSQNARDNSGQYTKVRLPVLGLLPGAVDIDLSRYVFHEAMVWERYASERVPNDVVYGESIGIPITRPYTAVIMTRYYEDHMQIMEQLLQRFSSVLDLRIGGNFFPSVMKYTGSSNNFSDTTPDDALRLFRTDVNLQVDAWLPQPMRREKTVLGVRIETGIGDPLTLGGFQKSAKFLVRVRPTDSPD